MPDAYTVVKPTVQPISGNNKKNWTPVKVKVSSLVLDESNFTYHEALINAQDAYFREEEEPLLPQVLGENDHDKEIVAAKKFMGFDSTIVIIVCCLLGVVFMFVGCFFAPPSSVKDKELTMDEIKSLPKDETTRVVN
jgi:hypothetical protein